MHVSAGKLFASSDELEWSHSLFGCSNVYGTFCCAFWCPCVVYGQNYQRLSHLKRTHTPQREGGNWCSGCCWAYLLTSLIGGGCLLQCGHRDKTRVWYGIKGNLGGDCLISCCCYACDLTQVSQEIAHEEKDFGKRPKSAN
ncbi:PLAC8 family-domain-containing protein [Mycena galopus ATCC 62051]|nr:PLAC8 family-domain-containing protein [Mycena galopus ATCC 62051]